MTILSYYSVTINS